MSAFALISGKLIRDPERKVSKGGKPFVTAVLREGEGDAVTWWTLLTFSESGIDELMTLKAGDALAASGSFKVEIYSKGGEQRLSYTLFADRVLSTRKQKRDRPARQSQETQSDRFDDGAPL